MQFKTIAEIHPDDVIKITEWFVDEKDQWVNGFYESICRTKEAMIRDALVKLGWTPPA